MTLIRWTRSPWADGRDEDAERVRGGAGVRRERRRARRERHFARFGDSRVGGGGDEGVVDVAAVCGAGRTEAPRKARRAFESVVLLARMVEVWRAEAVPEFVDESPAVRRVLHLRNGVRPQRVRPRDGRIVEPDLVVGAPYDLVRRRLGPVVRTYQLLPQRLVRVLRRAVHVACVDTLLLEPALGLDEPERVGAQFGRAQVPVLALESERVGELVPPAVVAQRLGCVVDCGVDGEDRPRDALRVVLVVFGHRAAVDLGEGLQDGFGRLGGEAVRECDDDEVHLELAPLHGRGPFRREGGVRRLPCGSGEDVGRDVRPRFVLLGGALFAAGGPCGPCGRGAEGRVEHRERSGEHGRQERENLHFHIHAHILSFLPLRVKVNGMLYNAV